MQAVELPRFPQPFSHVMWLRGIGSPGITRKSIVTTIDRDRNDTIRNCESQVL